MSFAKVQNKTTWKLTMLRALFFLMVIVMSPGISMAEEISQCPVDTVPIQIMNWTERRVTTLPAAKIPNPIFSAFVTAVTEHVAAKLAQEKLCLENAESKDRSLLQFVPWPVNGIAPGDHHLALPPLEAKPSSGCRISSPWIDLAIERGPVPWVRGIVRWNERQLLADQAVLAGASNVPPGVAIPLEVSEFDQYADLEYAASEIRHEPELKPIEERVPPDLLWLFRRAWQDPRCFRCFSGSALAAMKRAMKTGAEGYTSIVLALIDRCFASDGADIHYRSILDVANLIPLEQYKIVTPILVMPTVF